MTARARFSCAVSVWCHAPPAWPGRPTPPATNACAGRGPRPVGAQRLVVLAASAGPGSDGVDELESATPEQVADFARLDSRLRRRPSNPDRCLPCGSPEIVE